MKIISYIARITYSFSQTMYNLLHRSFRIRTGAIYLHKLPNDTRVITITFSFDPSDFTIFLFYRSFMLLIIYSLFLCFVYAAPLYNYCNQSCEIAKQTDTWTNDNKLFLSVIMLHTCPFILTMRYSMIRSSFEVSESEYAPPWTFLNEHRTDKDAIAYLRSLR